MSDVERLLAEALAAVSAGELATAADRFERAGAILNAANPRDASAAWESAVRLRLSLGNVDQAHAALVQAEKYESPRLARLRAEVADQTGDAVARTAAWHVVAALPDPDQRRFANIQLGTLARETGDHAGSVVRFTAALADVPAHGDALLRAEILLELAIAKTNVDDREGATHALDNAERALVGDDQGLRARIIGQRAVIVLANGDPVRALELAQSARAGAVANNDVMTYIAASSLIALIHEHAQRLVEAYDTYIRARESLAELIGPDGRALLQPAVTLFEERLGPEKFAEVWAAWKQRRSTSSL